LHQLRIDVRETCDPETQHHQAHPLTIIEHLRDSESSHQQDNGRYTWAP